MTVGDYLTTVGGTEVGAFAVDGAGGGDEDFFDLVGFVGEDVPHQACTADIFIGVAGDLVH